MEGISDEELSALHHYGEVLIENECRLVMTQQQINLILARYLYGDLTALEAITELENARDLIDAWRIGAPVPFGEIK